MRILLLDIAYFLSLWSGSCKWFLNNIEITILETVVRVVLLFLDNFDRLCKVLRVRLCEIAFIARSPEPISACLKLVFNVFVVIFPFLFSRVSLWISAFASQGKVSYDMSISRFHILISSSMSWKLRRVRSDILNRPLCMYQILRMRSLKLISLSWYESILVSGIQL